MLFHACSILLAPGTVILPGNYGRIIRKWGWNHVAAQREMMIERVRLHDYPQLVSRLDCCFALISYVEAQRFVAENAANNYVIYQAELVHSDAPVTVCDERRLRYQHIAMEPGWADSYWQTARNTDEASREAPPDTGLREAMVAGALRLLERAD